MARENLSVMHMYVDNEENFGVWYTAFPPVPAYCF